MNIFIAINERSILINPKKNCHHVKHDDSQIEERANLRPQNLWYCFVLVRWSPDYLQQNRNHRDNQ